MISQSKTMRNAGTVLIGSFVFKKRKLDEK